MAAVVTMACGCAALGVATRSGYNQVLRTWFGEPASDLLARWGQPDKRYPNADGTTILLYQREANYITNLQDEQPQLDPKDYVGASAPGAELYEAAKREQEFKSVLMTDRCITFFSIDRHEIVRQIAWTGNACRAVPPRGAGPDAWSASARLLVSPHALSSGGPS